jgi:hypothetical protein
LNIPANWTDDGTTLTAPNGQAVTGAFRQYILAHPWDGVDVPMGPPQSANPVEVGYQQPDTDQSGLRLVTMYSELCQTTTRGVYRASVGREFWTLLNKA